MKHNGVEQYILQCDLGGSRIRLPSGRSWVAPGRVIPKTIIKWYKLTPCLTRRR